MVRRHGDVIQKCLSIILHWGIFIYKNPMKITQSIEIWEWSYCLFPAISKSLQYIFTTHTFIPFPWFFFQLFPTIIKNYIYNGTKQWDFCLWERMSLKCYTDPLIHPKCPALINSKCFPHCAPFDSFTFSFKKVEWKKRYLRSETWYFIYELQIKGKNENYHLIMPVS